MNELIGKRVLYEAHGMMIECVVKAAKSAYGHLQYKIVPVAGSGHKWTRKVPGEDMEVVDE